MTPDRRQQVSFKESSRILFAQIDTLKEGVYEDLLVRYKHDRSIAEYERKWKLSFMAASISTALFSNCLLYNKQYPVLYTYFNIKMKEFDAEGESVLEDCIGLIADLLRRADYDPLLFSETIALWLYFTIRGKEELAAEETAPYMLVAQFIHNHFFNWFEGAS